MEDDHNRTVHGWHLGEHKGKEHILFLAALSMIIGLVILHDVFVHSICKAGGFSVKNPLSYVMIGGFLLLAAFKVKYLWRFKNRKGKNFKKKENFCFGGLQPSAFASPSIQFGAVAEACDHPNSLCLPFCI